MSCIQELDLFNNVSLASVALTLIFGVVRRAKFQYFQENPSKGAIWFFTFAGIKFVLGILLVSVLQPKSCELRSNSTYTYPTVVFMLAIYWAYIGFMFKRQIGQSSSQSSGSTMPTQSAVELT